MLSHAMRPTPMSPSAQALPEADIAPTATATRMSSCRTRLPMVSDHGVLDPTQQVDQVGLGHVVVGDDGRQGEEEDRDRDEAGAEAGDHRVETGLRPLLARSRGDLFDHLTATACR